MFNIEAGGCLPCHLTSPPPTVLYFAKVQVTYTVGCSARPNISFVSRLGDPSPRVAKTGRRCGVHLKLFVIRRRHRGDISRTVTGQGAGGPASCCKGPRRKATSNANRQEDKKLAARSHQPDPNAVGTLPPSAVVSERTDNRRCKRGILSGVWCTAGVVARRVSWVCRQIAASLLLS